MYRLLSLSLLTFLGSLCSWAGVDNGLLALVPSGVNVIGSIDVTTSRGSDFGQYLLAKHPVGDQSFEQMIAQTSFDPRRDLQHLMFASLGPASDGKHSPFAIFARGTFDEERIKAAATAKSAKVQNYQGVAMFVNQKSDNPTAFAFLDTGVAVMADLPTLQQIIANRTAPAPLNPDLASKIEATGANNDIWFVSLKQGGFLAKHMMEEAGPQAQALQSITEASGGIRFGTAIQASFEATTRSPQDANALADVVHFLASMVQMRQQEDPRAAILAPALNSMKLETAGSTLHFSLSVPEKSLEGLAELRPRRAGANTRTR
jgi:hypothetical protein